MNKLAEWVASSLRINKREPGTAMVPYGFQQAKEQPLRSGRQQVIIDIDNSWSVLSNGADREINQGATKLAKEVTSDPWLRGLVEFSVWAFGKSAPAKCYADAVPAERFEMPKIPEGGYTPLYTLIRDSLQAARERRENLANTQDCELASTWAFVFSDFGANDYEVEQEALTEVQRAGEENVNLFMLLAGECPCTEVAKDLAQPGRPPIPVKSIEDFTKFFAFLRRSLRQKSMSIPGTQIDLGQFNGVNLHGDA